MPDLRLKKAPQSPFSSDICPADFFLLAGWKANRNNDNLRIQTNFLRPSMKRSAHFSVDVIEDVFRNWIHRLVQVIASHNDYVQ
jgi:hypothetical protein